MTPLSPEILAIGNPYIETHVIPSRACRLCTAPFVYGKLPENGVKGAI